MPQLYIINDIRRSAAWLEQNGLTPDMPIVYPLDTEPPAFDPFTQRLVDGGTQKNEPGEENGTDPNAGDPDASKPGDGYHINWIVEALSAEELSANLPAVKALKLAEIITGANQMSAAIKARYSQPEIDSWQQQEAEAHQLLLDAAANAPLVRKLAANIGVDPLEFAERIVNNAQTATAATEAIILQQQAMEHSVNMAESIEAVRAVNVGYRLG